MFWEVICVIDYKQELQGLMLSLMMKLIPSHYIIRP